MTTDLSDTPLPPTKPDSTMSTPLTPDTNLLTPTTMHFEAAPVRLTNQQEINDMLTKLSDDNMKVITTIFETMSKINDDKLKSTSAI
jgi:hypothetical protein